MSCEDSPACGCCDPMNDLISPELAEELLEADFDSDEYDDSMDDHESALASVYGPDDCDDMLCEGYDEY